MKTLNRIYLAIFWVLCCTTTLYAQEEQKEKLNKATEVLTEFAALEENIPAELMKKAEGIVVIPNLIKAGLGIGGQRGKGVAMLRKADGSWSDPAFVKLTG